MGMMPRSKKFWRRGIRIRVSRGPSGRKQNYDLCLAGRAGVFELLALLLFVFFCGFLLLLVGFALSFLLSFCLFLLVVVEGFLLLLGGFFGLGFGF